MSDIEYSVIMSDVMKSFDCTCTSRIMVRIHPDYLPGSEAQSVTCLTADARLTADPGVAKFDPGPVPYFRGD